MFDDAESFYYRQDDDPTVAPDPPSTGGGGNGYIISPSYKREVEPSKREPFQVKWAEPGPELNLKALSDKLYALGKQLGRNKQAVKDLLKAKQASRAAELKARDAKLQLYMQLIETYELELYNKNAARLLILLADDR